MGAQNMSKNVLAESMRSWMCKLLSQRHQLWLEKTLVEDAIMYTCSSLHTGSLCLRSLCLGVCGIHPLSLSPLVLHFSFCLGLSLPFFNGSFFYSYCIFFGAYFSLTHWLSSVGARKKLIVFLPPSKFFQLGS